MVNRLEKEKKKEKRKKKKQKQIKPMTGKLFV
jgi:hypothetical protein